MEEAKKAPHFETPIRVEKDDPKRVQGRLKQYTWLRITSTNQGEPSKIEFSAYALPSKNSSEIQKATEKRFKDFLERQCFERQTFARFKQSECSKRVDCFDAHLISRT